jgi:23S rRNA pseudouridine1911/1915/1917 synthase
MLRPIEFPRQALHAYRLGFLHPETGQPLGFEAPVPTDLLDLLAHLRK